MDLKSVEEFVNDTEVDGTPDLLLCGDLLAFLPGSFHQHAEEVRAYFNAGRPALQDSVRYFLIDGSGRFRKATADTMKLVEQWAAAPEENRSIYGLDLESGKKGGAVSDRAFQMYFDGGDPGFVRNIYPAVTLVEHPEVVVEMAVEALKDSRFLSAYGGFAVNMQRGYPAPYADSRIAAISRRFHGIHLGRPLMFARYVEEHLMCPGWLTGIGDPLLKQIGGATALRSRLPAEVVIHQLTHGVLLQAGERPAVGDVNRQENMDAYRAVGKVITPLRIPVSVLGEYNELGGTERTREWLARFDAD